jgi:hypothetical protein
MKSKGNENLEFHIDVSVANTNWQVFVKLDMSIMLSLLALISNTNVSDD